MHNYVKHCIFIDVVINWVVFSCLINQYNDIILYLNIVNNIIIYLLTKENEWKKKKGFLVWTRLYYIIKNFILYKLYIVTFHKMNF